MFIAPASLFPLIVCKPRFCLHHSSLAPGELRGYDACALPAFRRVDARRHATFAKPRRLNTCRKLSSKSPQISTYDLLDFNSRRINTCKKRGGLYPTSAGKFPDRARGGSMRKPPASSPRAGARAWSLCYCSRLVLRMFGRMKALSPSRRSGRVRPPLLQGH